MRIALIVAAGLVASVALASPGRVCAQESTVIVSVDGVVFEEADDSSRVILRIEAGQQLKVIAQSGDWVQVQLPRGKGWILRKMVRGLTDSPQLSGLGDKPAERVTIVDEFADVKAGPGEAYLALKRIFRGDSFAVASRSEDGEWVQLRIDGDMGWVRADQIMASAAALPNGGGGLDGGSGDGGEVGDGGDGGEVGGGGGELGGLGDIDDLDGGIGEQDPGPTPPGATVLEVTLGGNFQLASQTFNSDTPSNPFLQLYNVDSSLAGPSVGARAWFLDYLGAGVEYQLGLGAPIEVQFSNAAPAVELSNQTHRIRLDLTGRFPISDAGGGRSTWAGLTVGGVYHEFNIQTVQQQPNTPPVFLTNAYMGLRVVAEANAALGPLDLFASGGVVLLGGLDQGQFNSGEQSGATFITAEGGVGFALSPDLGLFLKGGLDSYEVNFSGPATRQEDITTAINKDQFISVSSGLTWRPL